VTCGSKEFLHPGVLCEHPALWWYNANYIPSLTYANYMTTTDLSALAAYSIPKRLGFIINPPLPTL
jgi:hypothetical protein